MTRHVSPRSTSSTAIQCGSDRQFTYLRISSKAIDYSLKRWKELTQFVSDGDVPISNNWVENHIRPIALGRANWLFAGSLRAGKRAAAIMSLLHSARINGHDPYAYFKDVLERLPTHPASRVEELLPHRWIPAS
jgi:transposase